VSPIPKAKLRRLANRQAARDLLQGLVAGKADTYETYRHLWVLWCGNNAAPQELRLLFRMDGIEPEGIISINAEFREEAEEVLSLAKQILPQLSD
jgi:hypothetical protein